MAEPRPFAGRFDAIVLAGGSARRLGGVDKPSLQVGAMTLLERAITAVAGADRVVVVGPRRTTAVPVTWCREEPPGGGPVAAIAAGLDGVGAELVAVVASDLPFLTADVVHGLLLAAGDGDGALLVDDAGRDQLLVGAWRASALRTAMPPVAAGARLGAVLAGLHPVRVPASADPGQPPPWFDCDTDEDVATARGAT